MPAGEEPLLLALPEQEKHEKMEERRRCTFVFTIDLFSVISLAFGRFLT